MTLFWRRQDQLAGKSTHSLTKNSVPELNDQPTYKHFDRTCGLNSWGPVFFPEDGASRFPWNVSTYPAAPHNFPEDHRLHRPSSLNFTSHAMCTCVTWSFFFDTAHRPRSPQIVFLSLKRSKWSLNYILRRCTTSCSSCVFGAFNETKGWLWVRRETKTTWPCSSGVLLHEPLPLL